jgi:hypothetical protein
METITIICDDHPGIIAEVSEIAASTGANIESFEAKTVGTLAVVSISVDKHDETLLALAQSPFHAFSDDAILIQLDDKPGALAHFSQRFKSTEINLRSLRIIRRGGGKAIVAIGVDRKDEVLDLIEDVRVL